jgi:hypothetical protein
MPQNALFTLKFCHMSNSHTTHYVITSSDNKTTQLNLQKMYFLGVFKKL